MIVKGIVSEEELKQIKKTIPHHRLKENHPGEFRTWNNSTEIWVEIDVNEGLFEYLERTGFFTTEQKEVEKP